MPELLQVLFVPPLLVLVHWIYLRPGRRFKVQATVLWFVFGGMLMLAIVHIFASQVFLEEFGYPGPLDYLKSPEKFLDAQWGHF